MKLKGVKRLRFDEDNTSLTDKAITLKTSLLLRAGFARGMAEEFFYNTSLCHILLFSKEYSLHINALDKLGFMSVTCGEVLA